jgi:choline dehydrogenase-like flavoprotein
LNLSGAYVGLDEAGGAPVLDDRARSVLEAIAAALVPGDEHWPAAGPEVVDYLDATAARSTDLREQLARVCDELMHWASEPRAVAPAELDGDTLASLVEELERRESAVFTVLRALVYEGYYRDPGLAAVVEQRTGFAAGAALEGLELPPFEEHRLARVAALPGRFALPPEASLSDGEPWPAAPVAPVTAADGGSAGRPMASKGRDRGTRRVADVLVVGAGAAGAAVCARLGERGLDVVCLEQGEWYPPQERPKAFPDWEVRDLRAWSPRVAARSSPSDYPVTSVGEDLVDILMVPAVGGSTVAYGGHFWRLSPSDFELGTVEGYGVDWPISYAELAPYYTLNERITGVSGLAGDPTGPARAPSLQPPLPLGPAGERFADAFDRLGWAWWPQDQAIISQPHAGRAPCTNRGFCRLGCPTGSLSSADLTYWPRALEAGVELRTRCTVAELVLDRDGRAAGAVYYDGAGRLHEARARVVVVCANGLGTPRLLLMSRPRGHPDGLANSSGLVGRNLMLHVSAYAFARFDDRIDGWQGPFGVAVTSREFAETDSESGFQRGHIISVCRGGAPLMTALARAPWGPGHHEALERHLGHDVGIWVCGDDAPEPHNRIELDEARGDVFGLPGIHVRYRLSPNSEALASKAVERVRSLCDAAGAAEVVVDYGPRPVIGWHLMGTARMGHDRAASVVDATNRTHDIPNLYLVDGSSMPTGGCVNPTNTIQALALRTADSIWQARREWEEPA